MKNSNGQMTIEMILLIVIFFGLTMFVSKYMRDKQLVAAVAKGPWEYVRGMTEYGVWRPYDRGTSSIYHPSGQDRKASIKAFDQNAEPPP